MKNEWILMIFSSPDVCGSILDLINLNIFNLILTITSRSSVVGPAAIKASSFPVFLPGLE